MSTEQSSIFGLVIEQEARLFLMLTEDYSIQAYHSIKECTDNFISFSNKYFSDNYENHISGALGLIYIKPIVIKMPEDAGELLAYTKNLTPIKIKGHGFGYFIDTLGVEVHKSILHLSVLNISESVIQHNKPIV